MEGKRTRAVQVSLRETIVLAAIALIIAAIFLAQPAHRAPITSSETRFVETSPGGLQIVPASCPSRPSNPDYPHDTCSIPLECSATGCTCPSGYVIQNGVCIKIPIDEPTSCPDGYALRNGVCVRVDDPGAPEMSIYLGHNTSVGYIYNTQVVHAGQSQSIPTIVMPYGSIADVAWNAYPPYGTGVTSCTVYTDVGIRSARDSSTGVGVWDGITQPDWVHYGTALTQDRTFTLACSDMAGTRWQTSIAAVVGGPACTITPLCHGNDQYSHNSCTGADTFVQACAWGCAAGGCLLPPKPEGEITATPTTVRSGNTSLIEWHTKYVVADSCTVTEDNPDITDSWTGETGGKHSSGLAQQTIYTLHCTGVDGSEFSDTAKVTIIPVWQEQ